MPFYQGWELIEPINHKWNQELLFQLFSPINVNRILATPIRWTLGIDEIWWPHTSNGLLSVKLVYHALKKQILDQSNVASTSTEVSPILWKVIWNIKMPQKIKIFLWKLINNILPVQENLFKKKIARSNVCPVCKREIESVEHIFSQM